MEPIDCVRFEPAASEPDELTRWAQYSSYNTQFTYYINEWNSLPLFPLAPVQREHFWPRALIGHAGNEIESEGKMFFPPQTRLAFPFCVWGPRGHALRRKSQSERASERKWLALWVLVLVLVLVSVFVYIKRGRSKLSSIVWPHQTIAGSIWLRPPLIFPLASFPLEFSSVQLLVSVAILRSLESIYSPYALKRVIRFYALAYVTFIQLFSLWASSWNSLPVLS